MKHDVFSICIVVQIEKYDVIKKLGEGGQGAVYKARNTLSGDEVRKGVVLSGLWAGFIKVNMKRFSSTCTYTCTCKSIHYARRR